MNITLICFVVYFIVGYLMTITILVKLAMRLGRGDTELLKISEEIPNFAEMRFGKPLLVCVFVLFTFLWPAIVLVPKEKS
jgi:hypothetical protein